MCTSLVIFLFWPNSSNCSIGKNWPNLVTLVSSKWKNIRRGGRERFAATVGTCRITVARKQLSSDKHNCGLFEKLDRVEITPGKKYKRQI
jgi:hypothetical protein